MRPSPLSSGLFEELESRRLLSGASIDNETLLVSGSNKKDHISVTLKPGDTSKLNVVINGVVQTFTVDDFGVIKFYGKNGADKINVLEGVGAINKTCVMFGGDGKDIMHSASGDDSLDGGNGSDRMSGGDGDDEMFGGNGDDRMHGGEGDDHVRGGRGKDALDGDEGDDDLDGGKDDDQVRGDDGNDDFSANDHDSELDDRGTDDNGNNENEDQNDDHGDDNTGGGDDSGGNGAASIVDQSGGMMSPLFPVFRESRG